MKPKIGFIGLGIMGRHMAGNLLNAGYSLTVFDIVAAAMEPLVQRGAAPAKSCAEVARASDVVITMVTSSEAAEEAALGSHGVIAGAHSPRGVEPMAQTGGDKQITPRGKGLVFIDMSSSAPATAIKIATQLAKVGVGCLDAPVSGGELGAQQATLSIMVGGPEEVLNQVRPVFQAMGKTITLCGPHGAGQIVKACNQIQVALNLVGMAEALVLGAKAGVDPAIILKVLSGGYAQTRVMDVRGPKVIAGDFAPGGRVTVNYKDLGIALETADKLNVPLPGTALARQIYCALMATGRGGLDHSAMINVLEDLAGVKARTKTPSSESAG